MIYHGRPWNTVKSWSWCMTMIYHDRSRLWNWPCSIMIYHDKTMKKSCLSMIIISWSIMIDHGRPCNTVELWSRNDHGLTMVKSGPFHKCDRSCYHGMPCYLTMIDHVIIMVDRSNTVVISTGCLCHIQSWMRTGFTSLCDAIIYLYH